MNTHNEKLMPKCFALQAVIPDAVDANQYTIPENWLMELVQLLGNKHNNIIHEFNTHIGKNSTFSQKTELINLIKKIYLILSPHDALKLNICAKQAVKDKILEGLELCTPGFYNRVSELIEDLSDPQTIDEILIKMRKWIVDRVARQISDEVHEHNYIFYFAHTHNYGVNTINSSDAFIRNHNLNDSEINVKLKAEFNHYYQPLSIILEIKKLLAIKFNYQGYKKNGYVIGEYEQGLYLLQKLLNTSPDHEKMFIIHDYNTVDINWSYILSLLWQKKLWRHYFAFNEKDNQIILKSLQKFIVQDSSTILTADQNQSIKEFLKLLKHEYDVVSYIELFHNLTPQQIVDFIFYYIKKSSNKHKACDFFWNYAIHHSEWNQYFASYFIQKHTENWENTFNNFCINLLTKSTQEINILLFKTQFLSEKQRQTLFFHTEYYLQAFEIIALRNPQYLSHALKIMTHNESALFFKKHTIGSRDLSLLDIILFKQMDSNILSIKFAIENILCFAYVNTLLWSIPYSINSLLHTPYSLYSGDIRYKLLFPIAKTLVLTCIFFSFKKAISHTNNKIKIQNANLLPHIVGLIFNDDTHNTTQLPQKLLDQEKKEHNGEIKLALTIIELSSQLNYLSNTRPIKETSIKLRNNLAKELTKYANSSKSILDKNQLHQNWINYCKQAKEELELYPFNHKILFGLIIAHIFLQHPYTSYVLYIEFLDLINKYYIARILQLDAAMLNICLIFYISTRNYHNHQPVINLMLELMIMCIGSLFVSKGQNCSYINDFLCQKRHLKQIDILTNTMEEESIRIIGKHS